MDAKSAMVFDFAVPCSVESNPRGFVPVPGSRFHPLFVHQSFGEQERLSGFSSVTVHVTLADPSMHALVQVSHPEAVQEVQEGVARLHRGLDCGFGGGWTQDPVVFARDAAAWTLPPCVASAASDVGRYKDATGSTCVIKRWSLLDEEARAYHRRLEALAWWLIDAASPIDVKDDKWTVFGLFGEGEGDGGDASLHPRLHLIGYTTTYTFINPARAAQPKALRLCQMVIVPQHQRQGHGKHLLGAVYEHARQEDMFEVTVESPCEGMTQLRDVFDVEAALSGAVFAAEVDPCRASGRCPAPLSSDRQHAVCRALRVTAEQCQIAFEAQCRAVVNMADEEQAKAYRLMVKRRLYVSHELSGCTDAAKRKEVLEELFQEAEAHIVGILRKLAVPTFAPAAAT